ncbi:MAG: PAS domain S-box protein [bacterium]|nr:PAS domain S-box protein [bacterium]
MKIRKNDFLLSLIIFTVLVLIVVFSLTNIYEIKTNSKGVVHSYEVKMDLANNFSLLKDVETSARGFALTGNKDFKEPADLAMPAIQKNISHLRTLLQDDPIQLVKLDSLKELIDLKTASVIEIINAREKLGLNAASEIVSTQRGKIAMDNIRKLSDRMAEIQGKLLIERKRIAADSYFIAQLFAVVGGILAILIAILLLIINNRSLKLKTTLLSSEAKYKQASLYSRSLIEASLDPLVTISPLGKITDVNDASAKVTGETREKLIGTDFSDYFTEPEKAREGYKQVFEKGFVSDYPLTIHNRNGKLTDVLYNASVYKDDKGKVLGVFAAARDVTVQKQASLYARSLIEASLDPLVTISPLGKITDVNDASAKVTGETREKLIGTDFSDYFTEPEKAREGYKQVFEKGFVSDYPLTIHNRNGKLTDVLYNASVYKDDKGKVLGVFAAARDVSEQKRTTEKLKEARVAADLATVTAEDAKLVAENALHSKQLFLANMSHEIRTPMNAILGFTKILLKQDVEPKQKEYLDAIKTSSDGLLVLINDILDLAKVNSGKMTFEETPFKMESSVTTMLQVFEFKIQEKNLEIVKEYDNRIPKVLLGDAGRLHQILLNLLSNAIKFTEIGKITIAVGLLKEDEEKVIIEFAITDTGTGIPEDKLVSIFENFHQATSSTSRLFGGTGLGLAICKQLIEKQGGTILVKSKVNEGSTFSFTLGFQKTSTEIKVESTGVELDNDIKVIKVLLVEDIKLNQLLMKIVLDDFKFKYDIVDNGEIAIEKMQKEAYDIILMDLQMPVMNGFEATEYIRKVLKSKIPIIALTADVTTVDLEKCKAAGMNDYVSKPLDERILYSKMIQLLKR